MGMGLVSFRRAWIGALVAGMVLALAVPSIALAANTATFKSPVPAVGSLITNSQPTISLIGYDRYGVRASGISMWVGGVRVTPAFAYNNLGNKSFRLSYSVPAALSAGAHRVTVKVHDLRSMNSTYSWLFTTVAPAPVPFAHAAPNVSCTAAGCHHNLDVASIHLAKTCAPCHAPGVVPTTNCTAAACHGTNPPANHAVHLPILSSGTPACTQATCHGSAALTIHSTCAVCHGSASATVVAAIAAGGATCESCHGVNFYTTSHGTGNASHVVGAGSCFVSTCHGTDVTLMHTKDFRGTGDTPPGCAACHAAGKTPSTNCTNCHTDLITPHDYAAAHARVQPLLAANSTTCVACHGSDIKNVLPAGNDVTGVIEHNGCSCHAYSEARGKTSCEGCHTGTHAAHGFDQKVTGHNTTTYGTVGAYTKFDGSEGPVLHTIETSETSPTFGRIATLTTDWQLPVVNVFWSSTDASAPADAKKGLAWSSVVTCQDCHTGLVAAGPHGAAQNWGIDPNYPGDFDYAELTKWIITNPSGIKVRSTLDPRLPKEPTKATWDTSGYTYFSGMPTTDSSVNYDGKNHAVICSKCHDLMNFDVGMMDERLPTLANWKVPVTGVATDTVTGLVNSSAIGGSNTAHGQTHFDSFAGAAQCVNCHIAIPHGWKRPRLIVNSGPGFAFASFPATTTVNGVATRFMWIDSTRSRPADPAPYRSPRQFGTSDGVASFGGVSGGPWWGMEPFIAADWGETTKPNPAQANPNPVQPAPPHDRIDDHDALRVGMQSISGTDEHELILESDGSTAGATGHNNNYIEWVEYKCGACDFHHPYSDPRVSPTPGAGGDTIIVLE